MFFVRDFKSLDTFFGIFFDVKHCSAIVCVKFASKRHKAARSEIYATC